MEPGQVGGGVGALRGGCSGRGRGGIGGGGGPSVSSLCSADVCEDRPFDHGAVLGVPVVPRMHRDPVHEVQEPSSQGVQQGRSEESESWTAKVASRAKAVLHGFWRGDGRRDAAQSGENPSAIKGFVEGSQLDVGRCAGDPRGTGHDQEDARPEGVGGEGRLLMGSEPIREPLSEPVIRSRIREGKLRRRTAKQGTIRRLLGNCKKLAVPSVLFTCLAAS